MPDSKKEHLPARVEQRLDTQILLAQRMKPSASGPQVLPFITIARQYGCEAMALAEDLAARLPGGPWPIYNRQILDKLIEETRASERIFQILDVHVRSGIEEFFESLIGRSPTDLRLLHHLVKTVRGLAAIGHCIIVGRGAPVLTAGLPGGIHLRMIAPRDWREKNLTLRFGWSKEQTEEVLREEEHGRHNFFRKYLGQDANNPEFYDLMLNSARLSHEEQIETVLVLYRGRFEK